MKHKDYEYIYRKLNNRTPVKGDCGMLCNGRCCSDEECEGLGMYLFPGEEEMFINESGFEIDESEFEVNGRKTKILYCDGSCDRKKRPLSCRIFPLFPYISVTGEIKVIKDIRSKSICPLYEADLKDFSHTFIRGVFHIGKLLSEDKEGFDFLFELSRLLDDEKKLLKNDVFSGE